MAENGNNAWEVVIVGAGPAGLSAAIYLCRAQRQVLVIHSDQSMASWEPRVENYLGFPDGIAGEELLRRGRRQAQKFNARICEDIIRTGHRQDQGFLLEGKDNSYSAEYVLLTTGIFHIPPEIPHLDDCLGHSMFFCKDCDGYRVRGKRVAILGRDNETARYALALLHYSHALFVLTNGKQPAWDKTYAQWLEEYKIPVFTKRIVGVERHVSTLQAVVFEGEEKLLLDTLFTTRGDIVHNRLAKAFGAQLDEEGQVLIDAKCRTTVPGLYAAGCVTGANCQIIIAAGQGATAAQAISSELFEKELATHSLKNLRLKQEQQNKIEPEVVLTEKHS